MVSSRTDGLPLQESILSILNAMIIPTAHYTQTHIHTDTHTQTHTHTHKHTRARTHVFEIYAVRLTRTSQWDYLKMYEEMRVLVLCNTTVTLTSSKKLY